MTGIHDRPRWAKMPASALLAFGLAGPASAQAPVPPTPVPPTGIPATGPGGRSFTPPAAPGPAGSSPAPRPLEPGGLPPALPPAGAGSTAAGGPNTSALAASPKFRPAPLDRNDLRFPINLATALRLADARPLIVAAAQAGVWVAEAELTRAKVLWVPTLNIGFDYIRHDGGGPDFNKGILTAPSTNLLYAGLGATGSLQTADAIFAPLAARQNLNARHWDVQAAKNDAVLRASDAYFRVHQYRGIYTGALYTVERGKDLVERIARLSEDLVPRVEVDRALNLLADLEQRAVLARQEWRVAQRRPDAGAPARPPGGARAPGARPYPGHADRPRPAAGRPDGRRP